MQATTTRLPDHTVSKTSAADQENLTAIKYLLSLLAVPALLCVLPFFVVRMPSYSLLSKTADFPILEFAYQTAGQNADVVIYGDSSANHGIDPSQMSATLGTKVLDLPGSLSTLLVTDDLSLRRYMETNKPPKVIVLHFAPWNFDYGHDDYNIDPTYNGMEMFFRHGRANEISSFFRDHALSATQFPLMFYNTNLHQNSANRQLIRKLAHQVTATMGHADSFGGSHASSTCVIPSQLIDRIRFDWVRKIRDKYNTPQTKVLLFVAPIPDCTNSHSVVDRAASVIPAVPPETMPASLFVDDHYYIHLFAEGVPRATQSLIDAVRPLLDVPGPASSRLSSRELKPPETSRVY